MKMKKLSAIDIFCGCGGMTQGLKDAGFEVRVGIDIDRGATEVYEINHPESKIIREDIRRLSADTLMKSMGINPGELDLLGGCPPCQGFSALRTSRVNSIDDKRNFLIFKFADYIKAFRPKAILMENVPGLLRSPIFTEFNRRIENYGYHITYKVLNAKDYGVPQSRRRAVFMANRTKPVFHNEGGEERGYALKTVREAIDGLPVPGDSGDELHDIPENRTDRIKNLISRVAKNGGNLPAELRLPCHRRTQGYSDVYGRMAWDKYAPTITGGCCQPSKGRFIHPEQDRCITMREAALLQDFPADYHFPARLGKMKISEMIGNALPPPFVTAQVEKF